MEGFSAVQPGTQHSTEIPHRTIPRPQGGRKTHNTSGSDYCTCEWMMHDHQRQHIRTDYLWSRYFSSLTLSEAMIWKIQRKQWHVCPSQSITMKSLPVSVREWISQLKYSASKFRNEAHKQFTQYQTRQINIYYNISHNDSEQVILTTRDTKVIRSRSRLHEQKGQTSLSPQWKTLIGHNYSSIKQSHEVCM